MAVRRFVVALSLVAAVAVAQQKTTHIDVVVTDAKGKAIHGLSAADFEAVHQGVASPVASVAEVTESEPRRIVILFDNASLKLNHKRQVATALKTWVETNLRPIDHIAIGGCNPSLRQVLDWSNDKAAIATALDTATRDASNYTDQDRRRTEQLLNDTIERAADLERTGNAPYRPSFDELMRAGRTYAASEYRNVDGFISSINAVMTWFGRTTDKRVLLIASAALPRNPGYDMFLQIDALKSHVETNGPQNLVETARRASPLTEGRQYDVHGSLEQLRNHAVARGIVVYALNPGRADDYGSAMENRRAIDTSFAQMTNAMSGFDVIAPPSGGLAFAGVPPEKALAQLSSDFASYYAISYDSESFDDAAIRAKAGYRVRSSQVAGPLRPDERMREAVLSNLATTPSTNDLAIALAAEPAREAGSDRIVPLKVMIPISKLKMEPAGLEVTGGFSVYISTANGQGGATPVVKRTHQIRWPAEAMTQGQGKSMTFAIDVVMLTGFNAISVGVMDERSEKTGFERVSVR